MLLRENLFFATMQISRLLKDKNTGSRKQQITVSYVGEDFTIDKITAELASRIRNLPCQLIVFYLVNQAVNGYHPFRLL